MKPLLLVLALGVLTIGAQTPHPRYEYKIVHRLSDSDLEKLGDEGWQLAAATTIDGKFSYYYLMREK